MKMIIKILLKRLVIDIIKFKANYRSLIDKELLKNVKKLYQYDILNNLMKVI